jgi:ketosteroid isomerase-like protein
MNPLVSKFFAAFEKALAESDVSTVAALYSEVFMFGGPRGSQPVKKDDFLKLLPGRKAYFTSMGLGKSTVASIDETPLDARYTMAKVVWKMSLETATGTSREFETKATYILEIKNEAAVVIVQLDHQDLGERVKEISAT